MNKKVLIGLGVATAITIGVIYYRKQRQKQYDAGNVGSGSTPAPISNLKPSSPAAQAFRSNEVAPVYPVAPIAQKVQAAQPIAIAQPLKASEPVYMPSPAPAPVRSMVTQPSTSLPQPSEAKRGLLADRQVAIAGWDLMR